MLGLAITGRVSGLNPGARVLCLAWNLGNLHSPAVLAVPGEEQAQAAAACPGCSAPAGRHIAGTARSDRSQTTPGPLLAQPLLATALGSLCSRVLKMPFGSL